MKKLIVIILKIHQRLAFSKCNEDSNGRNIFADMEAAEPSRRPGLRMPVTSIYFPGYKIKKPLRFRYFLPCIQ